MDMDTRCRKTWFDYINYRAVGICSLHVVLVPVVSCLLVSCLHVPYLFFHSLHLQLDQLSLFFQGFQVDVL